MADYFWPAELAPFAMSFYLQPHTGGSESPFSRIRKVYGLSADRWVCRMSLRGGYDGESGNEAFGPQIDALVAKLKGGQNRAGLYDFRRPSLRGVTITDGLSNLAAAAGATSITLTGMTPGETVLRGDYIGGDGRPHIIMADATVRTSGRVVVTFEPPLYDDIAEDAVDISGALGWFRLTSDDAGANPTEVGGLCTYELEFVEDIWSGAPAPQAEALALFDTEAGDLFTDLIYTPNAALTVTDSQVAFSSATPLSLTMTIPASDGVTPLYFAFDYWTIEATFTATSFPSAGVDGAFAAARHYAPGVLDELYGMRVGSAGWSAAVMQATAIAGNAVLEFSADDTPLPKTFKVTYHHKFTSVDHTTVVTGGATVALNEPYGTGSLGSPFTLMSPILRFVQGTLTCTSLKFSADFPNAPIAFCGDSLTYGAQATPYDDGFARLVRAWRGSPVLIAGAGGSTTQDWETMVEGVARMKPRNAFICLGVNDFNLGRSVAATEASYTHVLQQMVAADINPIILLTPPFGNNNVPILNTWLKTLGYPYIDIYSLLVGTGVSLNAAYDSGDHIHWNNAGHAAVADAVKAYITANAL